MPTPAAAPIQTPAPASPSATPAVKTTRLATQDGKVAEGRILRVEKRHVVVMTSTGEARRNRDPG